ncbi:MAG: hypothetical protein DMF47_01420 [Verrucomicrobia bacterium]|nr:MAG: hypothetical protein DMF47_01420 [Verrucomicrobiota bacterium]
MLRAAREGHADRFDLINRCIGGEELPRQIIEPDVAPCRRERLLLGGSHFFPLQDSLWRADYKSAPFVSTEWQMKCFRYRQLMKVNVKAKSRWDMRHLYDDIIAVVQDNGQVTLPASASARFLAKRRRRCALLLAGILIFVARFFVAKGR